MSYTVRMSRQDGDESRSEQAGTVTYRQSEDTGGPETARLVVPVSALPDPTPKTIVVTLDWARQSPSAAAQRPAVVGASAWPPGAGGTSVPGQPPKVDKGDRVEIIKSRVSGVKSPPEWLEQFVGRVGVVLWTTPDGAMVDFGGDTAWFAYAELLPKV